MRRTICLFCFVLFAPFILGSLTGAVAQVKAASLHGSVRDVSGKPVNGAVIQVHNIEKGITVTVFSEQGSYRASDLVAGESEISAGLPGYVPSVKENLTIAPGKDTAHDVTLSGNSARPIATPADWIPLLPDDRDGAKELVVNRCVNCHGPREFMSLRLDRLSWKKVIVEMGRMYRVEASVMPAYKNVSEAEAASMNDEESERLADYLTKHFGPQAPAAPSSNPNAVAYKTHSKELNHFLPAAGRRPLSDPARPRAISLFGRSP